MIIQATAESLIGSIAFALFLASCGLIVGYIYCRRQGGK
jgi:hypothetical protein